MLSEFVTANRLELIERCRLRVAQRAAPVPTDVELEHGIPMFLDQLASTLRSKLVTGQVVGPTATKHGADLLHSGFTISQVVHNYGDVCQSVTDLAIERDFSIPTEDFRVLNFCLDEAIAEAVTEYERQNEIDVVAKGARRSAERETEDLGVLAHELRNMLGTAILAFDALNAGRVGISGSTGVLLGRSLMNLRAIIDRSLAEVRLNSGIEAREPIVIGELIEEVEIAAVLEARMRGHELVVDTANADAVVEGDRQILASVIVNLLQNAFKYTAPRSRVHLRTWATATHVTIEIEDHCGGLALETIETIFKPFEQRAADRTGLGLGLAICLRGVAVLRGTIRAHNTAHKGCVFVVELPRVPISS